ncbi:MAG: hypothetical protein Q7R99_00505 [bacterium]|nr:hypothetical protein [bacterium]
MEEEWIDKDFYKKFLIVPFGAVIVLMLAQGITWGFSTVLPNWPTYVGAFIFLFVVLQLSLLIVSRRLIGFMFGFKKHPLLFVVGLFMNSILIVSAKPVFILNPPTLMGSLPYIILLLLAWVLFPVVVSEKVNQSLFFKKIPEALRVSLTVFSYLVTFFSVFLIAMIDVLNIFFFIIKL